MPARSTMGRLLFGFGLIMLAVLPDAADASRLIRGGSASISPPVIVAGPSPFVNGCEGAPIASRVYRGSAVEPMVAVDPNDPRHLVAAWMQDRIATNAGGAVLAAVSCDRGATWTTSAPTFSRCAGGTPANGGDYRRAADPWLTYAANGDVFLAAFTVNSFGGAETVSAILVSKSIDGGATWLAPIAVSRDGVAEGVNDKPTIVADPNDPRRAYAVWSREMEADGSRYEVDESPVLFGRTLDGGETRETPRVIYHSPGLRTIGHVIDALPTGDLVDIFSRTLPSSGEQRLDVALLRSADRGVTWSEPVSISEVVPAPPADPYSTAPINPSIAAALLPTVAVDPANGRINVAWHDGRFSRGRVNDIALASSDDGGRSWSAPVRVNATPVAVPAFVPTLAVAGDGTIGALYYDLRSATPAGTAILTDLWLASFRAGCERAEGWRETHIAGPFDLARAAFARGFSLGDFQGLAGTANGFMALYARPTPAGSPGFSDVEFAVVTLADDDRPIPERR